ncbi:MULTISPECIES: HPP family protein [unclassified Rhizobacter]|uniref:HPP family protein n=1 Tax=unclassified Rhizobacter TaxID=2640088 RepID=UPI0006FAE99E|nr:MULTISPECIES: HPP family protein [unclassified Rhizobacter]KQU81653.1 hypothetical protein ASC88_01935 [Rhizobacter sp. Root29]KQW00215.1 hypothetical protein ASC98_29050 [Rhizobacter sp. Root1238]KRB13697.1 hypothetical protein ASE08_27575 [Rhizobacter sp. Root16D2]
MSSLQIPWLRAWLPAPAAVSTRERFRAVVGALLGIALTGLISAVMLQGSPAAIALIAPMGASAVLLFAVPASPLAQPWSLLGGNIVSAVIGVACAGWIDAPVLAAALAICLAIAAMFALRCLHPPSGAVALTAVLGGPAVHAAGYGFVLVPVALNSLLLLGVALLFNNATGRRYPHSQQPDAAHLHRTTDGPPTERLGFTPADLQAALKDYDQVLDIGIDDLESLFHQTEMKAFRRRFGEARCEDVMSKDVLTVEFATELDVAWGLMHEHAVQALPVVDRMRRVIGIVTRSDFLAQLELRDRRDIGRRLRALLARNTSSHSDRHEVVGQIMTAPVKTAFASMPAVELVPLMADVGLHHIPVVDEQRKLVGMVTQTDLVGALYEICLSRLSAPRGVAV